MMGPEPEEQRQAESDAGPRHQLRELVQAGAFWFTMPVAACLPPRLTARVSLALLCGSFALVGWVLMRGLA
jgi:hypothetical protein